MIINEKIAKNRVSQICSDYSEKIMIHGYDYTNGRYFYKKSERSIWYLAITVVGYESEGVPWDTLEAYMCIWYKNMRLGKTKLIDDIPYPDSSNSSMSLALERSDEYQITLQLDKFPGMIPFNKHLWIRDNNSDDAMQLCINDIAAQGIKMFNSKHMHPRYQGTA